MQSTFSSRIGFVLGLTLLLGGRPAVHANDRTWDGGGGDDNWSTADNWDVTAPVADDALFFDGSTRLTPNNDIVADTAFGGITFNAGAGAFILGGNRITLGGNVASLAANDQIIGFPMILDGIRTFDVPVDGSLTVSEGLSGDGGLTKTGTGTLILGGTNSFTGETRISDGIFRVGRDDAFAGSSGKLIIESGATFEVTHDQRVSVTTFAIEFGGTGYNGMGALRTDLRGKIFQYLDVSMTASALVVHATTAGQFMFLDGLFNMNGHTLTKEGPGTLNIARTKIDNFGDMVISQGELRLQQLPSAIILPPEETRTITLKGSMLNIFANSLTYPMNVSTEDGSSILGTGGSPASPTLTGTITLEGDNTIGHNFTMTISGQITGSGGFVTHKSTSTHELGIGMLILSGKENDYEGDTTVSDESILSVSNTSGSATGSGTVTVQSGGTLSGTGFIGGDVVINGGGTLSPAVFADEIGTLTFNSNLTLDEYAVLAWDFDATTHDLIVVGGAVTLPEILDLDLNNLDASTPASIPLITAAGGFTGTAPTQWDAITIEGIEYRFRIEGDTLLLGQPRGTLIMIR